MASRKEQKERARQERLAREAERAAAARRRRLMELGGGGVLVVIVAAVVAVLALGNSGNSSASQQLSKLGSTPQLKLASLSTLGTLQPVTTKTTLGPEGIPIPQAPVLAGTSAMATGSTVDGIGCLGQEQTLFHIHAHLTIYVNGSARQIPYGVGITGAQAESTPEGPFVASGNCYYWLHTHAADGIIHIESPLQRTYTLGDFFDIWGQRLDRTHIGPVTGAVTAIYNGQLYQGNPRNIPLNAHAQIQLEVGRPLVAPFRLTSFASL